MTIGPYLFQVKIIVDRIHQKMLEEYNPYLYQAKIVNREELIQQKIIKE